MRRKNPCFPVCTGAGRTAECHANCPLWAEYEEEKFTDYEKHEKLLELEDDINEHMKGAMIRMKRGKKK